MEEEEEERIDSKRLFKILITIGALVLLALVILFSVNSDDEREVSIPQEPVRTSKKDTIVVRRVVTIMKGNGKEKIYTTEQFADNTHENRTQKVSPVEYEKKTISPSTREDDFDIEYARSMQQNTIADVPARPRPQTPKVAAKVEPTTDLDEVLMASELAVQMKEEKSLWQGLKDKIASFFGSGDGSKQSEKAGQSSDVKEMLIELNAEIVEMQSRFVSYSEANGITYIDHINRPSVKGTKGFYIYLGVASNGFTFHRTVIRCSGATKLGLHKILLQTAASDRALIVDASEIVQVNDTDEWVDLAPTQENNELLNAVTSSENIKITFMGSKGNVEWVLSDLEVSALRESLHFYNLLKKREELLLN